MVPMQYSLHCRECAPQDPMIWYRLAEVRGLAGNISGLHQARAEYFILIGVFDKAREQLRLAAKYGSRVTSSSLPLSGNVCAIWQKWGRSCLVRTL